MLRIVVFLCVFFLGKQLLATHGASELRSPNGELAFSFDLLPDGVPVYSISNQGRPVVLSSTLGLVGWERGFRLGDIHTVMCDTVWKPVYGERNQVRDHFQEMTITLLLGDRHTLKFQIQVRAYNEGIAFRYFFPEDPDGGMDINIVKELTEFTVPEGTKAWFTNIAQAEYRLLPLINWPGESERPLVLQLPDGSFACLTEAQMVNYARTKFALSPSKPNTISCSIYDKVDFYTPFATPWRVVMVADRPGQLLANNDLLLNLNPPSAINNTSWIQPGKIMREMTLSMKGSKELVDFAVQRNIQYIHFDAGWYGYEYVVGSDASEVNVDPRRNPKSDLELQEIIRYANDNGVGVFLYVNQRALYQQLDELLPLFQQWGVRGIKFGFVGVGSHKWTTWLHDAIKKCARYNLMVNVHDEYRPTGFSRTYPNLLTQEGVYGNEEMPTATDNTILPFTRFIAGAADYTICYYQQKNLKVNVPPNRTIKTTSAHQMALSTIFYSPLQYMYWYDISSDSHGEPELEYFDNIATVWEDSKVLDGEIGQYITIARRKGEDWFVGTITNNDARALKIPLGFLMSGKKYEASIYDDDPASKTRTKISIKRIKVDANTVLEAKLIPSGGQAIWIRPLN